jgi:hypothetical protein
MSPRRAGEGGSTYPCIVTRARGPRTTPHRSEDGGSKTRQFEGGPNRSGVMQRFFRGSLKTQSLRISLVRAGAALEGGAATPMSPCPSTGPPFCGVPVNFPPIKVSRLLKKW